MDNLHLLLDEEGNMKRDEEKAELLNAFSLPQSLIGRPVVLRVSRP